MDDKFKKKIILVLIIGVISFLAIILFYHLYLHYSLGVFCVFNKITGYHCPGCGMTRAVMSLIGLDFYQAFRYNAFSIILLPVLIIYLLGNVYSWMFNKENFINKLIPNCFWVMMLLLLVLYGVLRNIPMLSYLAPTIIK